MVSTLFWKPVLLIGNILYYDIFSLLSKLYESLHGHMHAQLKNGVHGIHTVLETSPAYREHTILRSLFSPL